LFVSEEEAAEIYARVCRSWYGAKAQSVVDAKIRALQAKAEYKGVEAWKRVARALARHAKTDTWADIPDRQACYRRSLPTLFAVLRH
jgi:hypothetical protein